MENKQIMLPDAIQRSLAELLEDLNFKKYTLEITAGSDVGENYLGVITKIKVLAEDLKQPLYLLVKYVNDNESFRKSLNIDELYQAEIDAYELIFPEMIRLQEEQGIKEIFNPFPKVYKTGMVPPHEFLIMADKNAEGYFMRNKTKVIDNNHCLLTMEAYAKFHALSFAIREKKPHVWKFIKGRKEKLFTKERCEKIYHPVVAVINKLKKHIGVAREKALVDKLDKLVEDNLEGVVENISASTLEKFAVFCHGDSWSNNFLYQYQDKVDPAKPTSICIIDWQLSKYVSPAIDLSYFIFASTGKTTRQNHFDDLLYAYHKSMTEFLRQLGCDASSFTLNDLKEQMRKFSRYGLLLTILVVPLMLAEKAEITELMERDGMKDNGKVFLGERRNEKIVMERLTDIVRDFDALGYLDS